MKACVIAEKEAEEIDFYLLDAAWNPDILVC
jgi:hypothetical protein